MIPDSHAPILGLKPVLFTVGGLGVTSYALFLLLGLAAAGLVFWLQSRLQGPPNPHSWRIFIAALFFGALGAKLMGAVLHAGQYPTFGFVEFLYSGRSIIGGILGGWLGVKLVKRWYGITTRHGNAIAPAAALGIAIGRMGCLLGSCCYGKPTTCPWGIDFGDGERRHPTQTYEAVFALALFFYLLCENRKTPPPGVLFRRFLAVYLGFRFLIEFIRVEPIVCFGLTAFQIVCLGGLLVLAIGRSREHRPTPPSMAPG